MVDDFHQILWEGWLNNELSWSQFNLSDIHEAFQGRYQQWLSGDPAWLLRDPNLFYYPLFGLGNHDSSVAIVAAGPGHNITDPWAEYTETAAYREQIRGPVECTDKYESMFGQGTNGEKTQKEEWEKDRKPNGKRNNRMYDSLAEVASHIPDKSGSIFEDFYYTNFLKDGEFYNSGGERKIRINFVDLLQTSRVNTQNGVTFADWGKHLISPHEWGDLHWGKIDFDQVVHNNPDTMRKVCELLSREFWLPILARELTLVEPDVIVPTGMKAIEAVYRLCDIERPDTVKEVALSVQSTNTDVTLIPTYHLSQINRNIRWVDIDRIEGLPEEIRRVDGSLDREKYLEILGHQIKTSL